MIKSKAIRIPIYEGRFSIIHCVDKKLIEKEYGLENISSTCLGLTIRNNGHIGIILFEEIPSLNTIVHEITHAVSFVFINIGAETDVENDEPQAYLAGWFGEQIESFLKKSKK
jgi:hypothetical protein